MTVEQQSWVEEIGIQLKTEIEKKWPLSELDWEKIAVTIDEIVKKAKGNAEVRTVLFDIIEPYQKKEEELLKIERK